MCSICVGFMKSLEWYMVLQMGCNMGCGWEGGDLRLDK